MHSVFQPSWSWDKVWLKSRSSGGCCSVWWDTKGSSLLSSLPVQLLLQPGSCACLFEARCCAWNTHPISSVTSAEQWGHSGQAQPLLGCLYIQLVAMWAVVVAEPLLPIFVARTESLHGVSVHCLYFPRCLRMMLSRRISFFSWNDGLQLVKVQLALFTPDLCWEGHPWVARRHYSSHVQVVLEPLDVTSEQSFILLLNVCGHRRREQSLSDLFRAAFMYKTPEQRLIWANVRVLRSFLWKVHAVKCFIAFSWMEIVYNSNYSSLVCFWTVAFVLVTGGAVEMAVACHSLCARQGWPLLASWFKCSSVSQCLGAGELCFFPSTLQGTRDLWLTGQTQLGAPVDVVLWVSRLMKTFGNTQPSAKSQLPTCVWELVADLIPAKPFVKKWIGTASIAACVSKRDLSPWEASAQAFCLYFRLYLCGLLAGQTLYF